MKAKINLNTYLRLFKGREDVFAQQSENGYTPVQKALDAFCIEHHINGVITLGLYVLTKTSLCHLICIDIDINKNEIDSINVLNPVDKYKYLESKLKKVLEVLTDCFRVPSEAILLEDTGGRGYHIWLFFSNAVQGQTAVIFGEILKKQLPFEIEFFPKQGELNPKRRYGNLIKLPLGVHKKYSCRSKFFILSKTGLSFFDSIEDNLAHLESIRPIPPETIDEVVKNSGEVIPVQSRLSDSSIDYPIQKRPVFDGDLNRFIQECTMLKNLRKKAERGEQFSYSEAFHFANIMLSIPGGDEFIHETMRLSFTKSYSKTKTENEIKRIAPLHPTTCYTLVKDGLCTGYCKNSVRKKNEDPLRSATTPCSVWLKKIPQSKTELYPENILEIIGTTENIIRSFYQLKHYHKEEDALFFDPFDFEHFEEHLDANSKIFAKMLLEKKEFTPIGYFPVSLPKKLNEKKELEYRPMVYSTVYDQIYIQAIFNIVAPLIEEEFQDCSYGYRWNKDPESPYRIFSDWRKSYPSFRNNIISALKKYPNGYYVCCDIKGYYDHIRHDILLTQLQPFIQDDYIFQIIEQYINLYCYNDHNLGLPQGPAYARLLANLYLNDFDRQASEISAAYFRYVDDFVLIFENEKQAKEGLKLIHKWLHDLGLTLSQDESKKPIITQNTDLSNIKKTLEQVQYGMFESTRRISHSMPEAIINFWNAVERHYSSYYTPEKLTEINDMLPSFLYVVAQEPKREHPLKQKIITIIEFLIKKKWFYPKRLKKIFYRLLLLNIDDKQLQNLYSLMDSTHKVYFLLSVYGHWQTNNEHRELLDNIVEDGLNDENSFVRGFAIAIAKKLDILFSEEDTIKNFVQYLAEKEHEFVLLKWLPKIDYIAQSDDVRKWIRSLVKPASPEIIRLFLINNISSSPTTYIDNTYLKNLFPEKSGVILIPPACKLLTLLTDKSILFDQLVNYLLSFPSFKELTLSLITDNISSKAFTPGLAEAENLKSIYEHVNDDELQQVMISALPKTSKYELSSGKDFIKKHKEIARYNNCLFFKANEDLEYDFVELIPERVLTSHIQFDIDTCKDILEDLGAKEVLLKLKFNYDCSDKEIQIQYINDKNYIELIEDEFSLTPKSILSACVLAKEIYRKACYFHEQTGKVPLISRENLLIDKTKNTVVFFTIGRSLCTPHVIEETKFADEMVDIPMMISLFLESIFFSSKAEAKEFLEKKNYNCGFEAFLSLFIKNMGNKETSHRYSYSRFEYLVEELKDLANLTEWEPKAVYLRERLKGELFKQNSDSISWNGICRALDEHLSSHLHLVFTPDALFQDFPVKNHKQMQIHRKRYLHLISQHLLELALAHEDLSETQKFDTTYSDLVEFLLYYAVICGEVMALGRSLPVNDNLQFLSKSKSSILSHNEIVLKADDYEKNLPISDFTELIIYNDNRNDHTFITNLSLSQIGLLCMLVCRLNFHDNIITLEKSNKMSEDIFRRFIYTCLFRIPNVEHMVNQEIKEILNALESNDNFASPKGLRQIREDTEAICRILTHVRRLFRITRQHGKASGYNFPADIECYHHFRQKHVVNLDALPGWALASNFLSQKEYVCSWDLQGSALTNLMIPSEGLYSLVSELKKSKPLILRLMSNYSGKKKIFYDSAFLIIPFAVSKFVDGNKGLVSDIIIEILSGWVASVFFIIIYDFRYWIPQFDQFLNHLNKQRRKDE